MSPVQLRAFLLAVLLFVSYPAHPQSEDLLQRARTLNVQVLHLFREDKFKEALPLALEALELREKALGPDAPEVASSLNNLASIHDALGEYPKAIPLYERALVLKERHFGPDHPEVGNVAASLAWALDTVGDQARARSFYERVLDIREKTVGAEHPDTAIALNNLAHLLDILGEYRKALPLYERALAVNEKALGPGHPETANSLNNLAGVLASLADLRDALPLYDRALRVLEKSLGAEHPKVAITLNNLAQLKRTMGEFQEAQALLERSVSIREKTLGPEHPDTALGINNLAGLYDALGEYDRSRPLYERALGILEKSLGSEHPLVATCLANLASVFSFLGDYEAAKAYLDRSIAIGEKIRGPESPELTAPLNNLALLHYARLEFDTSRGLLERALAITEKNLGPDHPLVASLLNALSGVHFSMGDLSRARQLNERSLKIREKALGPESLETAISLHNLAGIDAAEGNLAIARERFTRALSLMEQALGKNHPYVARTINNLARVEAKDSQCLRAFDAMRQAQRIDTLTIDRVMAMTSDQQKLKYLLTLEDTLHDFLTLAAIHLQGRTEAHREALDVWLNRKGIVLEAERRYQEAIYTFRDPEAVRLAMELAEVRGMLSRLAFVGTGLIPPDSLRDRNGALTRKKEELETQLSALSQRFALEDRRKRATANSLSQVLPKGSALVEFSRFEVSDFRATKRKSGSFHYLAFILHPGKGSRVGLVDLGDTRKIDNAVAELRKAVRNTLNPRQEDLFQAARGLHDLVFSPLRKELGTARRLYVSPDGNLNLIPFEILRGPNDRFLIEDYTFNYLAAGRDLLGQGAKHGEPGRILLVGDPDFDKLREGALPGDVGTGPVVSPPPRGAFRTVRELRFGRLPGTRKEVMALADLLGREQVDLRLDEKANEDVLHFVDPPRVLHLATHGFFLNDRMLSGPDPLVSGRGFEIIDPQSVPGGTLGREAQESPLLRSGFALAGANAALAAGDPEVGSGIVTAEKILGMNLHGVEMVVLSACETGLGEVKAGEGVFGLRRAFVQAGARSLVMSLWNVPDQETQELMVAFYGRLVRGGINRNEALRQAALAELRIVTKRYGFPHPYYWGAFVFLGEP